jgi:hypothetical protein
LTLIAFRTELVISLSLPDGYDRYEIKMEKWHRRIASHFGVAVAQTAKPILRYLVGPKVSIRTVDKHIGVRRLGSVWEIAKATTEGSREL